jgi:hypothetical protein
MFVLPSDIPVDFRIRSHSIKSAFSPHRLEHRLGLLVTLSGHGLEGGENGRPMPLFIEFGGGDCGYGTR